MLTAKLDEDHKKLVSRNIRQEFSRFWGVVVEDGGAEFFKFLYPLFFRVYELSFEQRFLTKSEAMDYVLLRHAGTFKKYLEAAAARGFFTLAENPTDRRETLIKPGASRLCRARDREVLPGADGPRQRLGRLQGGDAHARRQPDDGRRTRGGVRLSSSRLQRTPPVVPAKAGTQ